MVTSYTIHHGMAAPAPSLDEVMVGHAPAGNSYPQNPSTTTKPRGRLPSP